MDSLRFLNGKHIRVYANSLLSWYQHSLATGCFVKELSREQTCRIGQFGRKTSRKFFNSSTLHAVVIAQLDFRNKVNKWRNTLNYKARTSFWNIKSAFLWTINIFTLYFNFQIRVMVYQILVLCIVSISEKSDSNATMLTAFQCCLESVNSCNPGYIRITFVAIEVIPWIKCI